MLSGPETARLLDQFEEGYLTAEDPDNSKNPKNHEMGQATQKTFQQQVNNLCDVIKCMGNPFLDDFPELVTLDSSRDCVDRPTSRGKFPWSREYRQGPVPGLYQRCGYSPYKNHPRHHQEEQFESLQKIWQKEINKSREENQSARE